MEKKILSYLKQAEALAKSNDIQLIKEKLPFFQRWLLYFQHERLIHLIVTALFSILSICSLMLFFISDDISVLLIFLIFTITDCFYIRHYYILENSVQKFYELIDIFYEKI